MVKIHDILLNNIMDISKIYSYNHKEVKKPDGFGLMTVISQSVVGSRFGVDCD